MSRLKVILFALLCIVAFATCKKEHDRPQWDVGVLGPLVKGSLGIRNFINDTLFKVNPDSTLTFIYDKTIYSLSIDSLVHIPDTTVATILNNPAPFPLTVSPNQTIYANTSETRLSVSNVQLRYAIVKSGKFRFSVTNRLHTKVLFTYTIPGATRNGQRFAVTTSVDSATSAGPSLLTSEYDLSGYDIDLTGTNSKKVNSISYFLQATTDAAGPTVAIPQGDTAVIIQTGFISVIPYYAKGYLGQATVSLGPDSTATNLFRTIRSGTLNLESAKMKLTIENDIGMDARLTTVNVRSDNFSTSSHVELVAPSVINQTLNINRAVAAGTNTSPSYVPSFYTLQMDNSNSNFKSLLDNLPDQFVYTLSLETNPFGNVSGDNDFIFADHLVNAHVSLEIPMNFSSDHLVLVDTADFSLTGNTTLDNLGAGSFLFNVENGFPFSLNITLVAIDSLNRYLDTLVSDGVAAAPPLDVNLKVTGKKHSQFVIPVDEARADRLRRAKRMVVTAAVTTAAGAQHVKIYSDYTLDFKLIADLIYHVR